jgi:hypothetical protein
MGAEASRSEAAAPEVPLSIRTKGSPKAQVEPVVVVEIVEQILSLSEGAVCPETVLACSLRRIVFARHAYKKVAEAWVKGGAN